MKNTIILLIFISITLKAQNFNQFGVTIHSKNKRFMQKFIEKTNAKIGAKTLEDTLFNDFIIQNNVKSIRPTYEGTKIEYLKDFYSVYFNENQNKFLKNLKQFDKSRFIDSVYQNITPTATFDPNDFFWGNNIERNDKLWHLINMDASLAWDITLGNPTLKIAVIDNGFDTNHPDLNGKINLTDPFNGSVLRNGNDHGTGTSVHASGITNGGGKISSIGFNSSIVGYLWDNAISKAHRASFIDNCKVISISFFYSCNINDIPSHDRSAIQEILDNGTSIIASGGNGIQHCGGNEIFPFANSIDSRIIKVASIDIDNNHASSSHYPQIDICAPGTRMITATNTTDANNNIVTDPYVFSWGTSIATPNVAGIVGLMLSANPCLNPLQIKQIIQRTALPIANANQFPGLVGAGRINAYRAVKESATRYFQNQIVATSITNRSFVDIGSNVTNTLPNGLVAVASNSNWTINAREVTIKKDFEVPFGSELTINTSPTAPLGCP